jgi:hypothetical protein
MRCIGKFPEQVKKEMLPSPSKQSPWKCVQRSHHIFHASKAAQKSFSLMLLSTACESLWMSDTVSKHGSFNLIFNLGNKAKSQGG